MASTFMRDGLALTCRRQYIAHRRSCAGVYIPARQPSKLMIGKDRCGAKVAQCENGMGRCSSFHAH
eukprot:4888275-Lingulodinium_polyedra.AAC.1